LDKNVVSQILSETLFTEEKNRRSQAYNAYKIYSGSQQRYVLEQIKEQRPKSWHGYTISDISISKMITDKRAQSYNESPIRNVSGDQNKSEMLNEIYAQADALKNLQFFDCAYNLHKYSLLWVNYFDKEEGGKYDIQTLQPYQFIVVRDKDTGELLIVGLNYPSYEITNDARNPAPYDDRIAGARGDGVAALINENQDDSSANAETWVFWSKDQHVKVRFEKSTEIVEGNPQLKYDVNYIPIPNNPSNINPLGVLPFIYVADSTQIDYPDTNPITSQSITYNVLQSETLSAKNLHGSGVATLKYDMKMQGNLDVASQGLMSLVELPQPEEGRETEFEYHTSGSQLNPMMEIDKNYLMQVLHEHGIENVNIDGGVNDMNGISRVIASASVQKVIHKNQQTYSRMEKKMFEIIKAWDEFNGTRMFNEDDDIMIVYPKPKVHVSDEQTLNNIEKMLQLGLIEEWEKFVKMDPNLTEKEARGKLARIESRRNQNAIGILGADNQRSVDEENQS